MRLRNLIFRCFLVALYGSAVACLIYFSWQGFDYYTTPYHQRPHHADYLIFKPAGYWGLRFGVIGSAMMFSLLFYVFRKRTRLFGEWFSLSGWLSVHIFFGVAGPLFVLLHTSFKLNGIVAISFWAMILVAMSGVLGRYLYMQIPKNIDGDQRDLDELEAEAGILRTRLEERFGISPITLEKLIVSLKTNTDYVSLVGMIVGDLFLSWRWLGVSKQISRDLNLPKAEKKQLLQSLKEKIKLERRMARLDRINRLFHHWHIIHRPFAAIMYLFMMIHIVVALLFGISWKMN